jgi:DNA-binding winged helix-turn-helix (wHTH) protein
MGIYRFGEFSLDTQSGELRRGSYRVRLRPQPAAILEYFVQHPDTVVTRQDLRRVLWPDGTFVHFDHGLNSCIKQLRAALLDRRGAPRYLETLPRRGYRFIAPVTRSEDLDADYKVSGTIRRDGPRLRISLEVTDPETQASVWSAEFECDADDERCTQARMAEEIARGLIPHRSSQSDGGSRDAAGDPPLSYFAHRSGVG